MITSLAENQLAVPYLIAGVLFIMSLGGLSTQETARRGNIFGIIGMAIAINVRGTAAGSGWSMPGEAGQARRSQ